MLEQGPGVWKLNVSLLKDKTYETQICEFWCSWFVPYQQLFVSGVYFMCTFLQLVSLSPVIRTSLSFLWTFLCHKLSLNCVKERSHRMRVNPGRLSSEN